MKVFLSIALIFVLASQSFGAFAFLRADTTDHISHGSAAALDNLSTFTVLAWVNTSSLAGDNFIWSKTDNGFAAERFFILRSSGYIRVELGRATTYAIAENNDSAISTNTWRFVGFSWDGTNAPKIYRGDLTTAIAEVSSYVTSQAGSGTAQDESANSMIFGNINPAGGEGFNGRIATVMVYNRVLSVGEMQSLQFMPRAASGCLIYSNYGYNGTTNAPDWSGNGNTGTNTGATVGDHVPVTNLRGY